MRYSMPSFIKGFYGIDSTSVTAGGSGDATAINGVAIDRDSMYSGQVNVSYDATLSTDETLTLAMKLQHSDDGTNFEDFVTLDNEVVLATAKGVVSRNFSLRAAKKYIRLVVTPDMSASDTDTASIGGTVVLTGSDKNALSEGTVARP